MHERAVPGPALPDGALRTAQVPHTSILSAQKARKS